jgi:hypothetical protein
VDHPDWRRVKDLFESALRLREAERDAFLESSGADPGMIAEVRSLLEVYEEAPGFLEEES